MDDFLTNTLPIILGCIMAVQLCCGKHIKRFGQWVDEITKEQK